MSDTRQMPEGIRLAATVVGGLLAYFAFRSLGDWLVLEVWGGHELAVRICALALCAIAGLAVWLRQTLKRPPWLTPARLAWLAAICGFLGLLLLFPIDSR